MVEEGWTWGRMRDDPDGELVREMAAGEALALETLYQRHGPGLLVYLIGQLGQRAIAEEVLQDVMLAAWESAPRFRGDSQVRTWLFTIARHRAANARRRRTPVQAPLGEMLAAADPQPPEIVELQDEQAAVRHALGKLSAEQRETLELVFFHELSESDVARVTGVAPGTVKSRLFRAKAALRRLLGAEEVDHAH